MSQINNLFRDCQGEEFKIVPTFWQEVFGRAGDNVNIVACSLDVFDDEKRENGITETNSLFNEIKSRIADKGELMTVQEDYFKTKREVKVTVSIEELEVNNNL